MKYTNPIIKGFHPDPSICRVGEEYYLVTSSFEYFPGIPVFHSTDLVNWEQIGNCIRRADEFPLDQVKDSGGVWAPTIRYDNGTFYVTATLEQYGNFIVSASDPAGDWSSPVWVNVGGIDPSLLFDDGKVYYCTNQTLDPGREEITVEEIDRNTGELLGEPRAVWAGMGGGFMEAPHIYHIGDWYYLMTAEGGTNFNHMVTVSRSRDIWGPYENCPWNPILTNAHDTSKEVQCSGHGDLVQDSHGNWWMVHLAIRLCRRTMSNLGRETFLTPVVWADGWPMVENRRKASLECVGPLWAPQREKGEWKADFTKEEWEPEWIFLRRPVASSYERKQGILRLYPTAVTFDDRKNPTFAAVVQKDFECELDTAFTFDACRTGDEAGIGVLLSSQFHYRFGKKRTDKGDMLVLEKTAEDFRQTVCCGPLPSGRLHLQMRADKEYYSFYYGVGDEALKFAARASTRFLSCEVAGRSFTGTVVGVYAFSEGETEAVMEVDEFKIG